MVLALVLRRDWRVRGATLSGVRGADPLVGDWRVSSFEFVVVDVDLPPVLGGLEGVARLRWPRCVRSGVLCALETPLALCWGTALPRSTFFPLSTVFAPLPSSPYPSSLPSSVVDGGDEDDELMGDEEPLVFVVSVSEASSLAVMVTMALGVDKEARKVEIGGECWGRRRVVAVLRPQRRR